MCRERAQIIGGSCESGSSADASEAENGGALYIRPHRHAIDQLGVDARRSDTGNCGEENVIDIGTFQAGLGLRRFDSLLTHASSAFPPLVVPFFKRIQRPAIFPLKNQVHAET